MQKSKNLGELMGVASQKSMSEQLYQKISKLIMSGELEEGYVFPNEAVLCEQLKIGRSTLREAYKALELSGYITRSKRGTTVNNRSEVLNRMPLRTVFHSANEDDFTQFRLMVEAQSASLAAARAGLEDVNALESLQAEMTKKRNALDYESLMELDEQFHILIANLSGNSLIATVISVMAEEWKAGIARNFSAAIQMDPGTFDGMIEQHKNIVAYIRSRDSEAAGRMMREHIESVTLH